MRRVRVRKLDLMSRIDDCLQFEERVTDRLEWRAIVYEVIQDAAEAPDVTFRTDLRTESAIAIIR